MSQELLRLKRTLKIRIAFPSTLSLAALLSVVLALLLSRLDKMTSNDYQRREQDEAERHSDLLARPARDQQQALAVVAAQLSRETLERASKLNDLIGAPPVLRRLHSSVLVAPSLASDTQSLLSLQSISPLPSC